MVSNRQKVGFLAALRRLDFRKIMWPEGLFALAIGWIGGSCLANFASKSDRITVVTEGLAVTGLLLGIVFAALTLLFSTFSDEYIILLDKANGGITVFTAPFVLAITFQVITVFLGIGYRAFAPHLNLISEQVIFIIWLLLFSYALLDIIALGRNVAIHGLYRAKEALKRAESQPLRQET